MKEKSDNRATDSLQYQKYKQYALDVVQGKQIACKYVIQACERICRGLIDLISYSDLKRRTR